MTKMDVGGVFTFYLAGQTEENHKKISIRTPSIWMGVKMVPPEFKSATAVPIQADH